MVGSLRVLAYTLAATGGLIATGCGGGAANTTPVPATNLPLSKDDMNDCQTIRVCNRYGNCWLQQSCYKIDVATMFSDPSVSTDVTESGAVNVADISPSGFPAFTGNGTVELYMQLTATPAATFPQTPQITLKGLSSVSGCIFDGYSNEAGNAYAWNQMAPSAGSAAVSGGSVTFNPVTLAGGFSVSALPLYGAFVCT